MTESVTHASETAGAIEQVRSLVEEYTRPEIVTVADPVSGATVPAVLSSDGLTPASAALFSEYLEKPRARAGTAHLTSLDSFIEHAKRFLDVGSVVFANDSRDAPSLTSVLDYHLAGATSDPRFGRHRGHFAFPLSDEWKAWSKMNGEAMKMADFAAFLDDRVIDVLDLIPGEDELSEDLQRYINAVGNASIASSQKLVELSRGLQVYESSAVREVVNLSSGEGQISFQSEHTDQHLSLIHI